MSPERVAQIEMFYRAICNREWDTMHALFSQDAELGFSGRSRFAGVYEGPDAITEVFKQLVDATDNTLGPVLDDSWDICVSPHHVVLLEWFGAKRVGRNLNAYLYFVSALEGNRIARMYVHSSEQYEFDEFFA
jgi:ketosteroid isomerase-like protein